MRSKLSLAEIDTTDNTPKSPQFTARVIAHRVYELSRAILRAGHVPRISES